MHSSIPIAEHPCELINVTPVNPLISKCQIKVCYVGEQPNRNKSIITKEVARSLANSLPGSPIVGYYDEETNDFDEHSRVLEIADGQLKFKDITRPYGFVDLNAKVWFQKFLDDGVAEREYLVTEGWLWTGQYPEAQRIIEKGNNQSMELDEKNLKAHWAKDENEKEQFFIINEAIISKLCILGEEIEPCFEGASIQKVQFSLENDFKEQLFSMIKEINEILVEGGANMDANLDTEVIEETVEFAEKDKVDKEEEAVEDNKEPKVCPECGKPLDECVCEKEEDKEKEQEDKKKYNLEEVVEYTELLNKYNELKGEYDTLNAQYSELKTQADSLAEFKKSVDKKEKEAMINSFYMLSDEDKKEVIDNIDTYSVDDIEAKLSVICVRNKVNFSLEEESEKESQSTFSLDSAYVEDECVPAWVKAVRATSASENI